jgi:hypothetical protein
MREVREYPFFVQVRFARGSVYELGYCVIFLSLKRCEGHGRVDLCAFVLGGLEGLRAAVWVVGYESMKLRCYVPWPHGDTGHQPCLSGVRINANSVHVFLRSHRRAQERVRVYVRQAKDI